MSGATGWSRWGWIGCVAACLCVAGCTPGAIEPAWTPGAGSVDRGGTGRSGDRGSLEAGPGDGGVGDSGPVDAAGETGDARDRTDEGPGDCGAADAASSPDGGQGLVPPPRTWLRRLRNPVADRFVELAFDRQCDTLDASMCIDGMLNVCLSFEIAPAGSSALYGPDPTLDLLRWALAAGEWEHRHHRVFGRSAVLVVDEAWLPRLAEDGCVPPGCLRVDLGGVGPLATATALSHWVARGYSHRQPRDVERITERLDDLLTPPRAASRPPHGSLI